MNGMHDWQKAHDKTLLEPPHPESIAAKQREIDALVTENAKLDAALRAKDQAMGILFDRLAKAGVDCSDLIS